MTQYLIAFNDEWVPEHTDEEIRAKAAASRVVIDEMRAAGVLVFTNGALDASTALCSVEAVEGRPVFTDGPYVETKEHLGGFAVIDVADDAAAREWAGRLAVALDWPQEVHRFRGPGHVGSGGIAGASAMPRYLLSVYGPAERTEFGNYPSKEAMLEAFADTGAFNEKLQREGYFVFADGLEPAATATVVDGQGDRPAFTDGPYLETKEHIGGFWVIEAPDLDVALALAAEGSKACRGTVEVRPFQTAESFPALLES